MQTESRDVEPLTRDDVLDTFTESIEDGAETLGVELEDATVAYLANMLWKFIRTSDETLDDLGFDRPVALSVLESIAETQGKNASRLLEIGELSVINCAFFEKYLTRRAMSVDYYQEIGRRSFMKVSRWYQQHGVDMFDVFEAIARKFESVVASVRHIDLKRKAVERE